MCVLRCMKIAVSVPEKEMMYVELNGVFHNAPISRPFLAAMCQVSRFCVPVHQAPVTSQRTVGGESGARKGRRSVYLRSAEPASDGGSRLTKGNVVNADWYEQVDRKKKRKNDGSCEEELQQLCAGKMLFFYANGWCVCCGWTMELMDGAAEVIPGNHWSAPCWAVMSAHLSWKVETNLEGRNGKDTWFCGPVHLYV